MKKTRILPLLAVALLCNCGGSDDKEPGAGEGNGSITVVEPTTALGAPNDDIFRLQLAGIVFPQRQIGARFFGGVAFNCAHHDFLGLA